MRRAGTTASASSERGKLCRRQLHRRHAVKEKRGMPPVGAAEQKPNLLFDRIAAEQGRDALDTG
jgi:hypothetical protein